MHMGQHSLQSSKHAYSQHARSGVGATDVTDLIEVDGRFIPERNSNPASPFHLFQRLRPYLALAFFPGLFRAIVMKLKGAKRTGSLMTFERFIEQGGELGLLWIPLCMSYVAASYVLYGLVLPAAPSGNVEGTLPQMIVAAILVLVPARFVVGLTVTYIYMGVSVGCDLTRSLVEFVAHQAGWVDAVHAFTSRGPFTCWELLATVAGAVMLCTTKNIAKKIQ